MNSIKVKIKKLPNFYALPTYAHVGDAGMDLYACEDTVLWFDIPTKIPSGIALRIPDGYEGQIRSRSGLSSKGVIVNSPGTIDSHYTGEICALMKASKFPLEKGDLEFIRFCDIDGYAFTKSPERAQGVFIKEGTRIAQLVIAPVMRAELEEVDSLDDTIRGTGGFGSSGLH